MTPDFSIITVNFNNAVGLKKTINSVRKQSLKNFEFIVIDGGSTDASLQIIIENTDIISTYLSEKDRGIYHGMNKGIGLAKGKYCLFLNSGDSFYNAGVSRLIVQYLDKYDIIYGNVLKIKPHYQRVLKYNDILTPDDFYKPEPAIHHQASFIRRALFDEMGMYNENMKIFADWYFFYKAIMLQHRTYFHVQTLFCIFDATGISNSIGAFDERRTDLVNKKNALMESDFPDYKFKNVQNSLVYPIRMIVKILEKISNFRIKKYPSNYK